MKKSLVIVALLLLAIPGVAAVDTEINVKTIPDAQVTLLIFNEAWSKILQEKPLSVGFSGETSHVFTSEESKIRVSVKVKEKGSDTSLLLEPFGVFDTGEPLYLQAIPGNISKDYMKTAREQAAKLAEEEAKKAEAEAAEKKAEEEAAEAARIAEEEAKLSNRLKKSINGFVSFEDIERPGKRAYYIGGIVLLVLVVGFFVFRHRQHFNFGVADIDSLNKKLALEKERVRGIRTQINKIRGSKASRIKAAEERLKADEEALSKLRGKSKKKVEKKVEEKPEEKPAEDKEEVKEDTDN